MAFQGLVVIPLFCGYDPDDDTGRLYSFDLVGGRYEEGDYASPGAGGRDARLYLRTAFEDGLTEEAALRLAMEALVAAAEEDTATGGPDLQRGIFPNVVLVSSEGYREMAEAEIARVAREVIGS